MTPSGVRNNTNVLWCLSSCLMALIRIYLDQIEKEFFCRATLWWIRTEKIHDSDINQDKNEVLLRIITLLCVSFNSVMLFIDASRRITTEKQEERCIQWCPDELHRPANNKCKALSLVFMERWRGAAEPSLSWIGNASLLSLLAL